MTTQEEPNGVNGLNGHMPRTRFQPQELVRLIVQALQDLGYNESASVLEQESGYMLESTEVARFRSAVMAGDWSEAEGLLTGLGLNEGEDLQKVKFLISQQKYLELLEAQQLKRALHVLRNELTPLSSAPERLHSLSSYMMCSNPENLRRRAEWDGAGGVSREKLLLDLQQYISSSIMVPARRLETLLLQANEYQRARCLYHDTDDDTLCLYTDHQCTRAKFPCVTRHILEQHTDEVWFVAFSNSGRLLASASKDMTVIIWDVEEGKSIRTLRGHTKSVSYVSWSPDDTMLLSCSFDFADGVKIWRVEDGECIRTVQKHTEQISACVWLPDGERFATAGFDFSVYLWNVDGTLIHRWKTQRTRDLIVDPAGRFLIGVCNEHRIRKYNLENWTEEVCIQESTSISSVCLSPDGKLLLVSLQPSGLHLWNLEDRTLERKYTGHRQADYIIRACFGGRDQQFVVSGSEDSCVYVWHRDHGTLIEVLKGHTSVVNSVAWNPADPLMFASASDDKSVRIWVDTERMNRLQKDM
ncbi:uncharacterized protein VTP21DRAFT_2929 [Calcarisporiella thermophila]|uniref:uncharacterized protein n=1 Tax=Calcarisporiella thermophila TaxID=911321 RepID=UPI003742E4AD